jgi:D-3-phosphoglycerate dehydrogenase / 2-oxoglutarate reductase
MSESPLLVVTSHRMAAVMENFLPQLENAGWKVAVNLPKAQFFSASQLVAATAGATAVIVGDDQVSDAYLESVNKNLKLVVKWGIGTDAIDFGAAEKNGVEVKNTPGVFGGEVADLAMAYLLALSRKVIAVHNSLAHHAWPQPVGVSMEGKNLGIIGLGDAGRNLAKRAFGFGMHTKYFDPYVEGDPAGFAEPTDLARIFSDSDFVVLTCPSTEETRGMINRSSLEMMRSTAFLVNVARGDLVNEDDLTVALREGRISGAGLDVYQVEPLPASSPLREFENVIFGAHNGSNTQEALIRASALATQIVLTWQKGKWL